MQIQCPECGCVNHVEQRSVVECYVLEHKCKCGFFLMHTDYNLTEAFKGFTNEIFKSKQDKMRGSCESCGG